MKCLYISAYEECGKVDNPSRITSRFVAHYSIMIYFRAGNITRFIGLSGICTPIWEKISSLMSLWRHSKIILSVIRLFSTVPMSVSGLGWRALDFTTEEIQRNGHTNAGPHSLITHTLSRRPTAFRTSGKDYKSKIQNNIRNYLL